MTVSIKILCEFILPLHSLASWSQAYRSMRATSWSPSEGICSLGELERWASWPQSTFWGILSFLTASGLSVPASLAHAPLRCQQRPPPT